MTSLTKYPGSVSQTSGGKFRTFSNLGNIKNTTEGSWATSNGNIKGKDSTPNRPSTISCTQFHFNLPSGAEVTKVIVSYRHKKTGASSTSSHMCNIPAPTITLLGVSGFSGKGVAPSTTMKTNTKTFTGSQLTRAVVNANGFGCKIDYPTNTNSYEGTVSVSYVRIIVEYKTSDYTVKVSKVKGGYNLEDYTVQVSISNKNLTSYNPTLTITSPAGFTYQDKTGEGTLTVVNARTFTWNPQLSKKVGTRNIQLRFSTNITFPSGVESVTGTFTAVESLHSTTGSHTATITPKPPTVVDEEDTTTPGSIVITDDVTDSIKVDVYDEFDVTWVSEEDYDDEASYYIYTSESSVGFQYYSNSTWHTGACALEFEDEGDIVTTHVRFNSIGNKTLEVYKVVNNQVDTIFAEYNVNVSPQVEDLPTPYLARFSLSDEETYRLGNGHSYTVQTDLKLLTSETSVRDWHKNFRIGVFNNQILANVTVTEDEDPETGEIIEVITDSTDYDDLTVEDYFEYADYWGETVHSTNTSETIECEFVFNEDYPLVIMITGDYPTIGDPTHNIIQFTNPCIVESDTYAGREASGNYPVSIINLIGTEDSATVNIETLGTSTPVLLYDFPLGEDYGTNDSLAIRGIKVTGNIEQSDELVLYAKMVSDTGATGQRSIILNDNDTTIDSDTGFMIGGLGDLWGFNTLELVNLEDWELELSASNILGEDVANLNLNNILVTFYVEEIEEQSITVKIEDENIAYYGAYLQELNIPEGVETDTSYLDIDGTDTNDAYRMNIRKKTISLGFQIGDCDIGTSSNMLRQLAKLLVNEKDQYNRPIPKKIEFSHYPDVYFEYVMEEALDVETEISGYKVKAKLVIPSGTAYSKEDIVTNTTGFVQGYAAVNPVITLAAQTNTITLEESVSGQTFNMTYNGDWIGKIILLNCEDREVLLMDNEDDTNALDISRYVDMNSDWFHLYGEYSFNCTNCVLRTVEYTERW